MQIVFIDWYLTPTKAVFQLHRWRTDDLSASASLLFSYWTLYKIIYCVLLYRVR